MPATTPPLVTGLLAALLTVSLGCVDVVEPDVLDDGVVEVRASPLLPNPPPTDPPPPPSPGPDPLPQAKVCKSSCEVCVNLHKHAYECLAYDKSFDDSPPPLAGFDCIVCDNDGPASAVHTCETQAKIQGVFFTDMEADSLSCGPPTHPRPVIRANTL
jgi:hypothetical protein